ncbi:hypothetical protein K9U39_02900 [Rhodoblastus acidophilus]|uniref:CorA-like Mg2+ transporter protein n=1 Tax=Candidatus Rhodoblastus alkanivorans TaxID=2954117 RepID=A0ABS9Z7F5_9HYPH|nr:hypothetical protein [Candidatus Rhodoblastus alkanivorans]MCI4677671.1 hypothetical protein [Candidatus Rhodoblastus alkanivorans]MCI4682597.1 hypothetical protein [Candidatus Rhodoblastus alkanivorans]MDI4639903.1 hypothetical protein [Rhodoblastus acidophilus]
MRVEQFRQILFWPLQLMPLADKGDVHWRRLDGDPNWMLLDDDFPQDATLYQERHYREFVSFLPHVQRFLYGERSKSARSYGESPLLVYRRTDIKAVRVRAPGEAEPRVLTVDHADVFFFYDADVMIPVIEISAENIDLRVAMNIVNRFGRAYPSAWSEGGEPANCFETVEWLDRDGAPLACADYTTKSKYYESVSRTQTIAIAAHWEFMLRPMVLNRRGAVGAVRYRPLEFHRMPMMTFLAVEDPTLLTRAEFTRLAFAAPPGVEDRLPMSSAFLADFERAHCYDRYFDPGRSDPEWPNMRLMCTPQALVMIGRSGDRGFVDAERGFLGQFRHQFFMLGLIAHFHRAAILMMSNRVVDVISRLERRDSRSVSRFRHDIREISASFLRFTHRYYFCEVSDQAILRDVFRIWRGQMRTEALFQELREEVNDMEAFMEADLLRRQAVTILQLTVVTLFSLTGTITTGFLGMNLFNHADLPTAERIMIFFAVFVPTSLLTFYTVMKSRRLAYFLNVLAMEKTAWPDKLRALAAVWDARRELPTD